MKKSVFYRALPKNKKMLDIASKNNVKIISVDNIILVEDKGYIFKINEEHFAIAKSCYTTSTFFTVTHVESGLKVFIADFKTINYALEALLEYDCEVVEKVKNSNSQIKNLLQATIEKHLDFNSLFINAI